MLVRKYDLVDRAEIEVKLELLKNVWYMAMLSSELKAGKMKSCVMMNEPIVFFKNKKGEVKALRDICPHRGIPLSYGQLKGDEVECPYHGWKFDGAGVCTEIPSLCPGQDLDCRKIKVRSYPAKEQQGMIWVFIGEKNFDDTLAPPVPLMEALPLNARPQVALSETFPCHIDHAVIGLMDPAHGPFIHKSFLWRSEKSILEKCKKFGPVKFGFQMLRHQPSANSKAYKILGKEKTTEITFTLPSVRVEHIKVGNKNLYSYTALTPISEKETRIYQLLYWDLGWLTLIQPFVKKFANFFLHQDIQAVSRQQDGLKYDPTLMLIKDADTQAKWYYALKEQWILRQENPQAFENPVKETELRWRS